MEFEDFINLHDFSRSRNHTFKMRPISRGFKILLLLRIIMRKKFLLSYCVYTSQRMVVCENVLHHIL